MAHFWWTRPRGTHKPWDIRKKSTKKDICILKTQKWDLKSTQIFLFIINFDIDRSEDLECYYNNFLTEPLFHLFRYIVSKLALWPNKLYRDQRCAESDFFNSYSAPVFQKLTPAQGTTPDYPKFIDSCSCLTPVRNRLECKQTLISQKHCD